MVVMQVMVDVILSSEKKDDQDFWDEYGRAYFEYERMEKMERLKEFEEAYEKIEDKDSFNAQYLEVLIDNLKTEV